MFLIAYGVSGFFKILSEFTRKSFRRYRNFFLILTKNVKAILYHNFQTQIFCLYTHIPR